MRVARSVQLQAPGRLQNEAASGRRTPKRPYHSKGQFRKCPSREPFVKLACLFGAIASVTQISNPSSVTLLSKSQSGSGSSSSWFWMSDFDCDPDPDFDFHNLLRFPVCPAGRDRPSARDIRGEARSPIPVTHRHKRVSQFHKRHRLVSVDVERRLMG